MVNQINHQKVDTVQSLFRVNSRIKKIPDLKRKSLEL